MGIQSQRREGAVKKCKKRGTRLLTSHSCTQYALDAGGVAFLSIENCDICKAKHLNSIGITTRIPRRAHNKACSRNLETRGASERNTFVKQEAARNLAANRTSRLKRLLRTKAFLPKAPIIDPQIELLVRLRYDLRLLLRLLVLGFSQLLPC